MTTSNRPRKWILVVDDDAGIRGLLLESLRQHGYSVVECVSATEALDLVHAVVPHLVILDLQMPRASGRVVLDHLRQATPPVRQIPVLIMSGFLSEWPIDGTGLNLVGSLAKPFNLTELLGKVREVIGDGTPRAG